MEVEQFRPQEEWTTNALNDELDPLFINCMNRIADKVRGVAGRFVGKPKRCVDCWWWCAMSVVCSVSCMRCQWKICASSLFQVKKVASSCSRCCFR